MLSRQQKGYGSRDKCRFRVYMKVVSQTNSGFRENLWRTHGPFFHVFSWNVTTGQKNSFKASLFVLRDSTSAVEHSKVLAHHEGLKRLSDIP